MSYWQLYLITRLDSLQGLFCGIATLFLIATVFVCIHWVIEKDSYTRQTELAFPNKRVFWLTVPVFVFSILACLTPSNRDLAIIYSGHFATHSEDMQKLPHNLLKYLNTYLEKEEKKD